MGRALEFALATAMITIVHLTFAFFVASRVANYIESLFTNLNDIFANL